LMGLLSSAKDGNDIMSPGSNTSGYGSRTLFGPEGAIALNNKEERQTTNNDVLGRER
jgi:hypothetical protein